jgi:hypothetical protein
MLYFVYQNKHNEEMAADLANAHALLQSQTTKHMDEAKALRAKIAELQGIVDEVNRHVQEQVDAIEAARAAEDSDGSMYSPYRDGPSRDASYSRQGSFCSDYGDSPMLRSVSFVLSRRSHPGEAGCSPVRMTLEQAQAQWNGEGLSEVDEPGWESKQDPLPSTGSGRGGNSGAAALTPIRSAMKSPLATPHTTNTQSKEKLAVDPMSPPRDAAAYWEPTDEYSAQFRRIYAGMQLLTTLMTHNMNEERLMRNFVVPHHAQLLDQTSADRDTIVFLEGKRDGLEEKTSYQQESLEYAKESERKALERLAQADGEYRQLSAKYQQMVRCEQSALGSAAKYEQLYRDLELQVQRLRNERKHLLDTGVDNNTHCLELEARIEEHAEAYSVLQSELLRREQELSVLQAERDELVKRCLRNGLPSKATSASATTSSSNSAPSRTEESSSPQYSRAASGAGATATASPLRSEATEADSTRQRAFSGAGSTFLNGRATSPVSQTPGPVRSVGLSGRTPSYLSSPLPSASSLSLHASTLTSPAPSQTQSQRVYYENTYGRYSTLTPQDKQPSEAFISMFGSHSKSVGHN